MNPAAVSK